MLELMAAPVADCRLVCLPVLPVFEPTGIWAAILGTSEALLAGSAAGLAPEA